MKKVILKTIIFVLIFLVLDHFLYGLFTVLFKKTDYLHNKLIKSKPEIVFFGNSRLLHGVNPDLIMGETGLTSYNISCDGRGIVYSRGAEVLIISEYQPKMFVVQVMPLSDERSALYSLAPYLYNEKIRELFELYPFHLRAKYILSRAIRYNSLLITCLSRLFIDYDTHKGYKPLIGNSSKDRTRTPGERVSNTFFDSKNGERLLLDFVREAKSNSIDMIFVEMPSLDSVKTGSYAIYRKIAQEYGIAFLDSSSIKLDRLQLSPGHFWDKNHLNHKGAKVFSAFIGKEIANRHHR